MPRCPLIHRFLACRRGAAAVEAAFVLPALVLFCMGIMEFGRMYWVRTSLQYSVEEAARYALAHEDVTDAYLQTLAEQKFDGVADGEVTVTVTRQTFGDDTYVTIVADYNFEFMTSIVDVGPMSLQGRSRVPLI